MNGIWYNQVNIQLHLLWLNNYNYIIKKNLKSLHTVLTPNLTQQRLSIYTSPSPLSNLNTDAHFPSLLLLLLTALSNFVSMAKGTESGSFTAKDYQDPPPAPLIDPEELTQWSFYRALIAEFIATLLFLYVTVLTVIGHSKEADACNGVGVLGIAWAFGGMIFILVYCTAGISGPHYIHSLIFLYIYSQIFHFHPKISGSIRFPGLRLIAKQV